MLRAGQRRAEQHEQQVDRLAVDGREIDRPLQLGENPVDPVEPWQLAMRDRDPVSDSGRAEALAFVQNLIDRIFGLPGQL